MICVFVVSFYAEKTFDNKPWVKALECRASREAESPRWTRTEYVKQALFAVAKLE